MISNLDKLINQDIRKNLEKKLSIKNIIEFSKDENLQNEMNHLILNYRDILLQSQIIKDKNDIIDEINNFNFHNFKRTNLFFQFLKDLVPNVLKFNYQSVIQLKINVSRETGIIKKWKNSILVVTYQGHILFFEEIPQKTAKDGEKEKDECDIIVKDELSEGILANKLVQMYLKTNYNMLVSGKKDNKFLFQIWSNYNGNKKSKQLNVDAIEQENLTKIMNVLNDNNDMNLTQINQ
jgi:hypothetical protein